MKKLALLAFIILSANTLAEEEYSLYTVNIDEPVLSEQEENAVVMSDSIKARTLPITEGSNGYIQYVFGHQTPRIVCSPMRLCDIKLQAGEQINAVHAGDTTRWLIEPAIEGNGNTEVQHIIIKPSDVGLETNIIVTTNRRVYHVDLVSSASKNIPKITFTYPEEALARFNFLTRKKLEEKEANTIPETREYLGNLDFEYEIEGDEYSWKPVRVYNDGRKTIIEMNKEMFNTEAPSLLVTKMNKNSDEKEQLVNYRLQNNKYIVDSVFYEAMLISGVGSEQEKITIRRLK